MRQLTLTNDQFDALYELLDETIADISIDLDFDIVDINDIEIYQVFQKLKTINYVESNQLSDDDYADKVDTLVGNMVASDDNIYTHDSEGC